MNKHHRLLTRLINTPLAISQDKLEVISSNVSLKLLAGQALDSGVAAPTDKTVATEGKTSVINVFDSLVSKGGAGESGFTSYSSIETLYYKYQNESVREKKLIQKAIMG